jgi:hypothetical protein
MSPAGFMVSDEARNQANADDDVHQEVGDVRREVAGELGGKASRGLVCSGSGGRHGHSSGRDGTGFPEGLFTSGILILQISNGGMKCLPDLLFRNGRSWMSMGRSGTMNGNVVERFFRWGYDEQEDDCRLTRHAVWTPSLAGEAVTAWWKMPSTPGKVSIGRSRSLMLPSMNVTRG